MKSAYAGFWSASLFFAIASMGSRFLGVVRDRVLAEVFGASRDLDIYYAAFRIPDFFYTLVITGAIGAAFLPLYARAVGRAGGGGVFARNLVLGMGVLAAGTGGVMWVAAPMLVPLIAPGFSPDEIQHVVALTRVLAWSPVLLALSSLLGYIVQYHRHVALSAFAPLLYNVGIIGGALFLVPQYGVMGLAYGVILGAGLHCLVQIPRACSHIRWGAPLRGAGADIWQALIGGLPRVGALAFGQVGQFVLTAVSTLLPLGSLALFTWAQNITSFPVGVFGVSVAIAAFPALAHAHAHKDEPAFFSLIIKSIRSIALCAFPSAIALIALRAQIIRLAVGSQKLTWEQTIIASDAVAWLAIGLVAQAMIPLLVRAHYAQMRARYTLIAAFAGALAQGWLAWISYHHNMGIAGLSWALSIGGFVQLVVLVIPLLPKLVNNPAARSLVRFTLALSGASLVFGAAIQLGKFGIALLVDMNTVIGVLAQAVGSGGLGLLVFVLIMVWLGVDEMHELLRSIRHKISPPSNNREHVPIA